MTGAGVLLSLDQLEADEQRRVAALQLALGVQHQSPAQWIDTADQLMHYIETGETPAQVSAREEEETEGKEID